MTKLVNRTYDVDSGRILVDGIDVRDWNMDSLRSQISFIEQDVTLFSRSVAENIGFSLGQSADREEIVRAARDAQAHEFIVELDERLRHGDRRARRHPFRRAASAPGDCAGAAHLPERARARRFDQRDRQRDRGRDPAGNPAHPRRPHDPADHAPALANPLGGQACC